MLKYPTWSWLAFIIWWCKDVFQKKDLHPFSYSAIQLKSMWFRIRLLQQMKRGQIKQDFENNNTILGHTSRTTEFRCEFDHYIRWFKVKLVHNVLLRHRGRTLSANRWSCNKIHPIHRMRLEYLPTRMEGEKWLHSRVIPGTPNNGTPFVASFKYYARTIPISLGILMGVVWE